MKDNDKEIHDDVKGSWGWMVNGYFPRSRHEREIKGFKYYRSFAYVFMVWKRWY